VSRRIETSYKAESLGKAATHVKTLDSGDTVNGAVVQWKFTFLSGEACFPCGMMSIPVKSPAGATGTQMSRHRLGRLCLVCEIRNMMSRQESSYTAPCGAIRRVREQESAEAILAQCLG
jgi:hypothetical protein